MPETTIDGARANWEVMGSGPRRGLALHCSLARASVWRPLAGRIGDLVTLVAPDLPGHGRAAPWAPGRPYHEQAMPIVEHLAGQEGQIDLIGHSMGAVLALAYAVRHPERIRTLTLYEPVLFAALANSTAREVREIETRMEPFEKAMKAGDTHAAAKAFSAVWGGAHPWADIAPQQQQYLADRIHLIAAAEPLLYHDAAGILAKGALDAVAAPCLLLSGARSPAVTGMILDVLSAGLPRSERGVVDSAAHMAPITRSDAVAQIVRPFLLRHP